MSDLISRSEVNDVIDKLEVYTSGRPNTMKVEISVLQLQRLINKLKNIPTAYDVDKVIEELEGAKHEIYLYDVDLEYYQNRIDKAIEIVKQSGVSDASYNVCEWKKIDEEGYKNCECNYDETIPDFFKYCPYCRKKIKIVGD